MFIEYYRRPNKSNMEKSLFSWFDEINNWWDETKIIDQIKAELMKELDQDLYQLASALGIESQSKDDIHNEILFKKNIYDILHSDTTPEQQRKIVINSTKHTLLYQLYLTTREADIDDRLASMSEEITSWGTTDEEITYITNTLHNAQGCFYDTFEQNKILRRIIEKINEQQDECSSDTISDFMHMTWNRIVHRVYKTEWEGMDLINKIIQHMNPQEMEYILERLREKNMSMYVGLTDFDKYIHKQVSEKLLAYNTH